MKSVKVTVTHKVPDWNYCNHSRCGSPTKDNCRFCVKTKKCHVCVLYNMPLDTEEGLLIKKTHQCIQATYRSKDTVEDTIQVDPKNVMKLTMQEYRKIYKQLIAQGYPDNMADKMAQQMTMGGN